MNKLKQLQTLREKLINSKSWPHIKTASDFSEWAAKELGKSKGTIECYFNKGQTRAINDNLLKLLKLAAKSAPFSSD